VLKVLKVLVPRVLGVLKVLVPRVLGCSGCGVLGVRQVLYGQSTANVSLE
jgi:hypothetical protein